MDTARARMGEGAAFQTLARVYQNLGLQQRLEMGMKQDQM